MGIKFGKVLELMQNRIVTGADADKDPGLAINQCLLGQPRPFQRFPTDLKEQAMLRIDPHRFTWRNAKEERVKLIHIVDKGGLTCIHFAGKLTLRIIKLVHRPAAVRHFPHQINAGAEQLPELFRRLGPRKATSHADHGNWFIQAEGVVLGWAGRRDWRGQGQHGLQQVIG